MTSFMRLRLWARQAPPAQVAATAFAVIVMAVLLVVFALPAPSDNGRSRLAAGGGGGAGAGADGSAASGAQAGDAGTPAANPNAGATPTAAGATTGAGGSATASANGTVGANRPATASAPAGGSGATGAGGAAGPGAPASQPLTASDIGVTPTTVKLGFLIAQVGGLDQAGFALGLRTDIDQVIKAYVDDANAHGGAAGRKIVYVTAKVDPLTASNQRAACLSMTEDQKVFAVLDSASTLGAQELCYGAEHHTPYFDTGLSTVNADYVRRSFPYQVSTAQDGTRQVLNWANYVGSRGGFNGHKVGVLSDDCAPDPDIIDKDLKPALAKFNVTPVDVRLSCDSSTAQQQIPSAVLQMRQAGVDLVFPGTIFTNVQVFLQTADAQNWHPKYSASDYYGMAVDLFTQNFPADQWAGTQATTASHDGETKAGKPQPAPVAQCSAVLTKAGLPPIQDYGKDAEAVVHCDSLRLFVAAANRAGANLTRLGWANAVQQLGTFDSAFSASATFKPGKTEGGDSIALEQWLSDCKCYTQIRPHDQPAYA